MAQAVAVLTFAAGVGQAAADDFAIALEQPVSNGVPGPGAGFIEVPGGSDTYALDLAGPTTLYLDEFGGSCAFQWSMTDPLGALVFFDNAFCVADPGLVEVELAGTYTITVVGTGSATGAYSFTVWEVDPPQAFAIGLEQPVSNGVPGPGAGFLEEPGAVDVFTFDAEADETVYFDELSGNCAFQWTVTAPSGQLVFADTALCVGDPGVHILPESGTYLVEVSSLNGAIGTYSFTIWTVEPPQSFTIVPEQAVSPGVPGPGAGVLEEPAAIDLYAIDLEAGVQVYFDENFGNCAFRWRLTSPSGGVVFDDVAICAGDPGVVTMPETGTYQIEVYAPNGASGNYGFATWLVDPPQQFEIVLEQTVSNGVPAPGAGNLEEPGAVDVYTLPILAGTVVYFDELGGGCALQWTATSPSGAVLFNDVAICGGDPGEFTIVESGLWTLTVFSNSGSVGTYSFTTNVVVAPEVFDLEVGQVVSDGVPGPGAGNIEGPGSVDVYLLALDEGADVCFQEINGGCPLVWTTVGPDGATLFSDPAICVGNPGRFSGLAAGTYSVIVSGDNGAAGTYSFVVKPGNPADLDGDCMVGGGDLGVLLAAWGPCPRGGGCSADLDGDGAVGGGDLGVLLAAWGDG